MARLEGEALLQQMLTSKQEAISRRAAEGRPVPEAIAAGAGSVMALGEPVFGEGADATAATALEAVKAGQMGNGINLGVFPSSLLGMVGLPAGIAGASSLLGMAGPVLSSLGLPAGIAGAGAALYGVAQALGLGEGGGIGGINLLGGDEFYRDGIPMGGPGLPEPPAEYILKEWHVSYSWGRLQYYLVQMPGQSRKIAMYNTRTKRWKVWTWRQPRLAVIGKNMPSHKMITRLRRNLKKHSADARTITQLTNPTAYAKSLGYKKYRRRR